MMLAGNDLVPVSQVLRFFDVCRAAVPDERTRTGLQTTLVFEDRF